MSSDPSAVQRAAQFVRQRNINGAMTVLSQAADRGDRDALLELAVWRLTGEFIPRDLPLARELFRRAAAAGHADGARIYNAFLANGTGGRADWESALDLLRQRAAAEPEAASQLATLSSMTLTADGSPQHVPEGEVLSTSPHVEMFPRLFSPSECDFLIQTAEPLMQRAVVVDPRTGQQVPNPVRTADAAGFPFVHENPAVHALNKRIAAVSGYPATHGEPLQVLRYQPGQQYRPHSDALPGADNQRAVTVLVYLNDNYTGGETRFSAIDLSVRGEVGDALLFRNVTSDGRPDERSSHAGLPVTGGIKLIASRWIRVRPLDLAGSPQAGAQPRS